MNMTAYKSFINLFEMNYDRAIGVSGIMRVKNDAEFVRASIYSCIDALDELIIVYNDCSDNSPIIINEIAQEYPTKIKVYKYNQKIYAWNLSNEEIEKIFTGEIFAKNTLYGYYNFALSKTTKKYVMKIDADQIYFTHKLKELCDAYRYTKKCGCPITSYWFVILTNIRLKILQKYGIKIFHKKTNLDKWQKYYRNLLKIIQYNKPNISLYGLNVFLREESIYISLGRNIPNGLNILGPYNGGGDHPIFKMTNKTFFVPYIDKAYNKLNGISQSVIERLVGVSPLFIGGICWIHLNAYRLKNREYTALNLLKFPNSFIKLELIRDFFTKSSINNCDHSKTIFKYIIEELDCKLIKSIYKLARIYNL